MQTLAVLLYLKNVWHKDVHMGDGFSDDGLNRGNHMI